MYLIIDHASGYIERSSAEEKEVNKYFIFDSTDENEDLLKNTMMFLMELEKKNQKISGDECDYEKNYMKIKFNSDDNLPLNKPLKFRLMTLIIRCVFKEDGKFYLQFF